MQPYSPSWFRTHRKSIPITVGEKWAEDKVTGMSVLPKAAVIVCLRTEISE